MPHEWTFFISCQVGVVYFMIVIYQSCFLATTMQRVIDYLMYYFCYFALVFGIYGDNLYHQDASTIMIKFIFPTILMGYMFKIHQDMNDELINTMNDKIEQNK